VIEGFDLQFPLLLPELQAFFLNAFHFHELFDHGLEVGA